MKSVESTAGRDPASGTTRDDRDALVRYSGQVDGPRRELLKGP
jgi:hypothetical protein